MSTPGGADDQRPIDDLGDDHEDDFDEDADAAAPGWGLDLQGLLSQAQDMQQKLLGAKAALADTVVEGSAGGGVVTVMANGSLEFLSVHIDPDAVDPADTEMLQDLILAALRDTVAKVNAMNAEALGGLGGALGGLLS